LRRCRSGRHLEAQAGASKSQARTTSLNGCSSYGGDSLWAQWKKTTKKKENEEEKEQKKNEEEEEEEKKKQQQHRSFLENKQGEKKPPSTCSVTLCSFKSGNWLSTTGCFVCSFWNVFPPCQRNKPPVGTTHVTIHVNK
jgi:outer membrane biosynthesis protein TonB